MYGDLCTNLDDSVCISNSSNNLGKGMNPNILHPPVRKIVG